MQAQSALLQCVLVSLTFLSAAQGQQARGSFPSGVDSQSSPDLEAIIRNMEAAQEASRPQLPYEAVRDYRPLEGDAPRINAEVVARITFLPPNVKNYSIQDHTGITRGADVRMLGKRSLVSKVLDYREGEALALQRKPVALQGRGLPRRRARQAAFSLPMQSFIRHTVPAPGLH